MIWDILNILFLFIEFRVFNNVVFIDRLDYRSHVGFDFRCDHLPKLDVRIPGSANRLSYFTLEIGHAIELSWQFVYL